jgi:hypothetical protein
MHITDEAVILIAFKRLIVFISELEYIVSSHTKSNTRLNIIIIPFKQ